MKPLSPIDASHERCWCPLYGAAVAAAMQAKGWTPQGLANALKIDVSNVLGYRRGFQRNRPNLTAKLEELLGVTLPYNEPRPSKVAPVDDLTPATADQIKRLIQRHLDEIGKLLTKLPLAA